MYALTNLQAKNQKRKRKAPKSKGKRSPGILGLFIKWTGLDHVIFQISGFSSTIVLICSNGDHFK